MAVFQSHHFVWQEATRRQPFATRNLVSSHLIQQLTVDSQRVLSFGGVEGVSLTVSKLQLLRSQSSKYKNEQIQTVRNGVLSEIFAPSIDVRRQHLFHHAAVALIRLIRSEAQDAEILQRKTKWHQPLVQLLNESHPHLRTLILNNTRHYWCCCLSATMLYKQYNDFPSTVKFPNSLHHCYPICGYQRHI